MLAHYRSQTWKAAGPACSLEVSEATVRRYLDLLTVLHPGAMPYALADRVSAVALAVVAEGRTGALVPTGGGRRMPRKAKRP